MRDENEVQKMADKATDLYHSADSEVEKAIADAVATALDWVLDENMDESPI